ncbi:MAG: methyltransferase domain-containing protein [Cytophagales bacterium]|nr:methyltransferase domain-containing protein [Rhizobacter sp.]
MNIPYDKQTVDSPNPLARYAHRSRIKNSVRLALSRLSGGKVLDYGCGSGVFISTLNSLRPQCAVGYEPYMADRRSDALPIYSRIGDVEATGPFSLITLFETIEHLSEQETTAFLRTCDRVLSPAGGVLVSGPIEIGPALIAKELSRSLRQFELPDYGLGEFLKASVLGVPGARADNIKTSHKGFDFRRAMAFIKTSGWRVEVLEFGPLPIGTWYGNSQVYLWLTRDPASRPARG